MTMTYLLTGGAGYIGSHTAVELIGQGHDVVIADNYANSDPAVIDRIEMICGKRPVNYVCDISDSNALENIFRDNRIDGIIHFAGFKAVGESVRQPLKYYRNNLDCTLTLLECMLKFGVNQFIFSSSATVYGTRNPIPYTEDMDVGGCSNPYGWTKFMTEQILKDTAAANSAFSAVLLRYFNPVGAHSSGLIGEAPNGIPNNLMPYISQVAAGKLEYLNIYGNDYPTYDGTGVRDYIHVMDLARGHIAAIKYCETHSGVEAINLGTGRGCSVLELVRTFSDVNNVDIPYRIAPRRPGDLAEFYASPDKALRLLNWQARLNIEDMCRDTWKWQLLNPNGYKSSI